MTADRAGQTGPDRDQLRQQLAEVLDPFTGPADALLDALLPVVEAHTEARIRAARADELERAARAWRWSAWSDVPRVADRAAERIGTANYVGDWIAARAKALRTHEGDTDG